MSAENELKHQLDEMGYRLTRSREDILTLLRSTDSHPDAYWVYDRMREGNPNISLGTVYRTLGVLVEAGLIQQLLCGQREQAHYDGNVEPHYHITCNRCGAIRDLALGLLEDLERQAEVETGFVVEEHSLSFRGLCPRCARAES